MQVRGRLAIEIAKRTGSCSLQAAMPTHERRVRLPFYDSFLPSFYHKIKFSNGIEKCFVCMYVCRCTCIHACHRKISILLLIKAINQFTFFF